MQNGLKGEVKIEHNGKTHTAKYEVEKGMLTVRAAFSTKTTQLSDSPPEVLARILLSEMAQSGKLDV